MGISIQAKTILKQMMVISLSVVVILIMSGCGDDNQNTTDIINNTDANDVLQTDFSNNATVNIQPVEGGTATGEATITYNDETKVMSVEVKATGLEPDSEHMQHIHSGTCEEFGDIIYPLDNLKADGNGEASSTNTFQDVEKFDAANMILNIHHGPDMEGDNPKQISCGIVTASG